MDTRERGWPASLVRIAAILTFVAAGEIVARSGMVGSILLPPPSVVARTGWRLVSSQELFGHVWSSLFRVLLGFGLASAVAIPLGVIAGWYPFVFHAVDPLIELFRPIPVLALLPMAILWFGIGETSKIFLIFYTTVFLVLLNTMVGVSAVPRNQIRSEIGRAHV